MKQRWTLTVLLLVATLFGGCSTLYLNDQEAQEVQDFLGSVSESDEVLRKARVYREQGEVVKALGLLHAAKGRFPQDEKIAGLTQEYERSWKRQQLRLENQLLLIETRRLIESLPILEELATGHPNSHFFKTRILLWRSYLDGKVPELLECSIEFERENIWLAKRCLAMAYRISPTPETRQRLTLLLQRIDRIQQAADAKLEQQEERERADRIEQLLSEAIQEREQGAYLSAKLKIDEALKQDPESPQVREQLSQLQEALGQQVDILMKLGDKLYRKQQTGAAITAWEAALKLDPNQHQIAERILRAKTVLKKLESIRSAGTPPDSR